MGAKKIRCGDCGQLIEPNQFHSIECCESFKAGIREAVEWIPELIQAIKDAMWEDDWGVKGVIYDGQLDALVRRKVKDKLKEWGIE